MSSRRHKRRPPLPLPPPQHLSQPGGRIDLASEGTYELEGTVEVVLEEVAVVVVEAVGVETVEVVDVEMEAEDVMVKALVVEGAKHRKVKDGERKNRQLPQHRPQPNMLITSITATIIIMMMHRMLITLHQQENRSKKLKHNHLLQTAHLHQPSGEDPVCLGGRVLEGH